MTLKEIFSLKREFNIKGTKTYFFDMCLVIKNKSEFQDKSITKIRQIQKGNVLKIKKKSNAINHNNK